MQLEQKIYKVIDDNNPKRIAKISIAVEEDGNENFMRCEYVTVNSIYDLDDWAFLKKVAEGIEELAK